MLGLPVRPRSPAPAEQSPEAHSASGWATRAQRGTVRTVAPSRLRRSAVLVSARLDGQPLFFGWGANLSRAEKERVKERVALVGLSGLLALIIFLVGGALLWDKVIYAQQPMVRVDGQTVATLRQYTDVLSYRTNLLFAEYQQMQQLAGSGQGENNPLAAYAFQRLNQLQGQILGLQEGLLDEFAEDVLVRREAAKRQIAVTPEEIDAEIKRLIGYQDPNVTAAAPVGQETVAETTPAASATTDSA
ncbi:MAG: hypothetical protein HY332_07090, partial [Chloroflexi bacterium]|nr:hypothetical protein [Chloroflexota bacterium]